MWFRPPFAYSARSSVFALQLLFKYIFLALFCGETDLRCVRLSVSSLCLVQRSRFQTRAINTYKLFHSITESMTDCSCLLLSSQTSNYGNVYPEDSVSHYISKTYSKPIRQYSLPHIYIIFTSPHALRSYHLLLLFTIHASVHTHNLNILA